MGVGAGGQIDIYNFAGDATVDVDVDGYYSGGYAGTGSVFVPITPVRVEDTRSTRHRHCFWCVSIVRASRAPGIDHSVRRLLQLPPTSLWFQRAGAGFITVYPTSDGTPPLASDVNWAAGSGPVPNFTVAETDGPGLVDVYNLPNSTPVNLVIDDFGYFLAIAGGGFHAIACPSTTDCVAVGQGTDGGGLVEVSNNGGASFTDEPVPAGLPALFGVACPDVTHCFAVGGSDFIASTDGGQSWNIQSQSGVDLYTVACESDCRMRLFGLQR